MVSKVSQQESVLEPSLSVFMLQWSTKPVVVVGSVASTMMGACAGGYSVRVECDWWCADNLSALMRELCGSRSGTGTPPSSHRGQVVERTSRLAIQTTVTSNRGGQQS